MSARVVFVDNRDSFSFNLVDEFRRHGAEVEVWRSDRTPEFLLARAGADGVLVLSPGPGTPERAGCCVALVRDAVQSGTPVLGICLGHQAIVVALGGEVGAAPLPVHGRASRIIADAHPALAGLRRFDAGRYHSLAACAIPPALEVIARTEDGLVMAVAGRRAPVIGLQFHPESILTPDGPQMIASSLAFLSAARGRAAA